MRWLVCALLASFGFAGEVRSAEPVAPSPLQSARTGIEQWVQTRQLLSKTRSDWDAEKEVLLQTKALYERELASVESQISKVSTNSVQVDRERGEAETDLKASEETLTHARDVMAGVEVRIRALTEKLPGPLTEAMAPLLARLPKDSASAKVSATERVQTAVSLLNEIDKFNNAVGIYSEKRRNAGGEEVSVETVYIGLGAGYFVNQTGEFAGKGKPGAKGWEWSADPALAASVREVIRIYRGEKTATFVPLPVSVE